MPLPLIIGGIALAAGAVGAGTGIHGGVKMKKANDTMKRAQELQEKAVTLFDKKNADTSDVMDKTGSQELKILNSFEDFSNVVERIQGRPEFKDQEKEGITLPEYKAEELHKISAGASLLLGSIGGATVGTTGGFAAAGATTYAIMAFGTASTGTAISALSGVAASNATLAAIGGGAIAAGGGGMALGATLLGGTTLGIGLLAGGVIFNYTGIKLSKKADEAMEQAKRTHHEVEKVVGYLDELRETACGFQKALTGVEMVYREHLADLTRIVIADKKTLWSQFTEEEKRIANNTVLLVGLLYRMCNIQLVLKNEDERFVNHEEVEKIVTQADDIVNRIEDNSHAL